MNSTDKLRKETVIDSFPKSYKDVTGAGYSNRFHENVKKDIISDLPISFALKLCKVIVIGDISVGKSSLIRRFTHDSFKTEYKATIGVDFQIVLFQILNMPFSMQM